MPELPDVEVFKRYLAAHGLDKPIQRVVTRDAARMLEGVSAAALARALEGRALTATARHGKHLFARIDGNGWLMLHFGMSGFLAYGEGDEADAAHDRLVLHYRDRTHLAFNCRRKLGAIALTADPARYVADKGLGPDALAIDEAAFVAKLDGRSGSVKGLLMDQTAIAGIGNIYSDEILFQAAIHPRTRPGGLDPPARHHLYATMRSVLQTAIRAGAAPERLPESFLIPLRRRKGARCPYCGGSPRSITVVGRTAWFCPCRQPPPGKAGQGAHARPQ